MSQVVVFYPGVAFGMFQLKPEIIGVEIIEVEGEGGVIQPKLADPDIFYTSEIGFFYLSAGEQKQDKKPIQMRGGWEGFHAENSAGKKGASRFLVTNKISMSTRFICLNKSKF